VLAALHEAGVSAPVVVGGIIPDQDVALLEQAGVAAVYTPKDFDINRIMRDIVELVDSDAARAALAGNGSLATGTA
jgi:(2R)-ethylmalonyl-CoA mutase